MSEILKESIQILNKNDERQNLKIKYKKQRLQEAKQIYVCQCQKIYLSFPALYLHVKNKHKLKLTTKVNDNICKREQKGDKSYITYFLKDETEFQTQKEESSRNSEQKNSLKNDGVKTSKGQGDDHFNQDHDYQQINRLLNPNYLMRNIAPNGQFVSLESVIGQFQRAKPCFSFMEVQFQTRVFGLLIEYIAKICQFSKQFDSLKKQNSQTFVSQLPLFMNEFLSFYLPMMWGHSSNDMVVKRKQIEIMKNFCDWLNLAGYSNLKTQSIL